MPPMQAVDSNWKGQVMKHRMKVTMKNGDVYIVSAFNAAHACALAVVEALGVYGDRLSYKAIGVSYMETLPEENEGEGDGE